ncbi:hypothetical protein IACHDJAJ_00042 [Aeromonas phage vB_AdhS_TS3]|nr:hypothetical protein IACHDJAJ_00042 [Aeromonas phage vB_AdhS_TS3]
MSALITIMWFLGTCFSIALVFQFVGLSGLNNMFPECKRWWHFPVQLTALAFFALMVLINPFM